MANTLIIYQGDGSTIDFVVPFDYLKKSFIKVYLDTTTELTGGSSTDTSSDYYFVDSTTIRLRNIVPSSSQTITIRRYTSVSERVASFRDGSVLYAKDLDISQVQAFHIAEEARDILNDALTVDRENNWDAKNKRIIRVADPIANTDAVNKEYVDTVAGVQKALSEIEANVKQYRDDTEGLRDDSLVNATSAKASAGTAVSAMETTVASAKEVSVKHAEVIEKATQVSNDAEEVADNTSEVYQNTQQVARDKAVVVEAKNISLPVIDSLEQIKTVADNIDSVKTDATHIDNIDLVSSDLEGTLRDSIYDDYGTIGSDTTYKTISGGNIKIVADNIDVVKVVAGLAPDFEVAIKAVTTVTALTTRAETAALSAVSSESSASSSASTASSKATEATTQANLAKEYADSASKDASTASTKATEALTSAANSANSASEAKTSASTASSKATEATNSATNAATAQQKAEEARDLAQAYVERVKQVDWNQTDSTQVDYIKNKPDVATIAYVDKAYDNYGELS